MAQVWLHFITEAYAGRGMFTLVVQQNLFGAEGFVFKNWFDLGTRLPITSSAIEFVSFDGLYIQGELG